MFQRSLFLLAGLVLVASCSTTPQALPAPRMIDVSNDEQASINIGKEYYLFTDLDNLHTQLTKGSVSGTVDDQLAALPKYLLTKVYILASKNLRNPDQPLRLQYVEIKNQRTGEVTQVPLFTFNQGYYRTDLVTVTTEKNAEASLVLTNEKEGKPNDLKITLRLIDKPLQYHAESLPVELVNRTKGDVKMNGVFDTLVILVDGRAYGVHALFSNSGYPRVIYSGTRAEFEMGNQDDSRSFQEAVNSCIEKMKAGTLEKESLSARYYVSSTDTTYMLEPIYSYKENPTTKLEADFVSHDQGYSDKMTGKVTIPTSSY